MNANRRSYKVALRWRCNRHGHTLVELLVSMGSASLLMAGLASCLLVAGRAFDGSSAAVQRSHAAEVQSAMLDDLQHANSFATRNIDSVTFHVADRDGDAIEETISYTWLSGTNELKYSYNGNTTTLLEDVTSFQFGYASRYMPGLGTPSPYDSSQWGNRWPEVVLGVVFESFEDKDKEDTELVVNTPDDTVEGDLLIAAVATDQNTSPSLSAPAGWNLIAKDHKNAKVTFAVWWKIAAPSEPESHTFTWNAERRAYGWIMRFTGHDPVNPINAWAVSTDTSATPVSPVVTTTVDNAMVLRMGGFDDEDIEKDEPGLPGHTPINMDDSKECSGGSGYALLPVAGSSGESTFALTASEETVAITIAIAPASSE